MEMRDKEAFIHIIRLDNTYYIYQVSRIIWGFIKDQRFYMTSKQEDSID